jgi:ATP-dependent Clp protease ATP-binding subunit ClpB
MRGALSATLALLLIAPAIAAPANAQPAQSPPPGTRTECNSAGLALGALGETRLQTYSDGQGRTVDFRNTVVVMTSNLGSQVIQELAGEDNYVEMKEAVMEIVSQHFRPEFINRIDEAVVFHPLGHGQIRSICKIQIDLLRQRLQDRDLGFEISEAALDLLGEAGFDPVYGARPLKRAIQRQLENPLANQILSGQFVAGDVIKVDVVDDNLSFNK